MAKDMKIRLQLLSADYIFVFFIVFKFFSFKIWP